LPILKNGSDKHRSFFIRNPVKNCRVLIITMNTSKPQVNTGHYFRKKYDTLERFISYFYQIDLVQQVAQRDANLRMHANDTNTEFKVLEIGKGNGTVSDCLKKLGYQLTTVDIDESLKPDYVADVRNLPFKDNEFDAVVAYEILEHLPFEDFEKALQELKRVSNKHIIISLPYRSTGFEFICKFPGIRTLFRKSFLDFFVRIPLHFGGIKVSGQHYWEIDRARYSLRKIRKLFSAHFTIVKELSPVLNKYHRFFVLKK